MKHTDRDTRAKARLARLMAQLKPPKLTARFWALSIPLTGVLAWLILHSPYNEGLTLGGLWAMFLGAAVLGRLAWGWPVHKVALVGLLGLVAMRGFIEGVTYILSAL